MKPELDCRDEITSYFERQDEAHLGGAYDYLASRWFAPRWGAVAAYIQELSPKSILDVGCGESHLLRWLSSGIFYTGVDVSSVALSRAAKRWRDRSDTNFVLGDIAALQQPLDQHDLVAWLGIGIGCTKLDHHPEGWGRILKVCLKNIRPRGALLLECISPYREAVLALMGDQTLTASCTISIQSDEPYPERDLLLFDCFEGANSIA